jgi:GNAT superfamily N-acetyltransferase
LDTWRHGIADGSSPGFVCLNDDLVIGMCFYDNLSAEVLVVAVHPEYEGQNIGKKLLQMAIDTLKSQGRTRSFLGCNPDPASRSNGFYRHLGWKPTGETDSNGDEILEILL